MGTGALCFIAAKATRPHGIPHANFRPDSSPQEAQDAQEKALVLSLDQV
jgi:hypothetical protein